MEDANEEDDAGVIVVDTEMKKMRKTKKVKTSKMKVLSLRR